MTIIHGPYSGAWQISVIFGNLEQLWLLSLDVDFRSAFEGLGVLRLNHPLSI